MAITFVNSAAGAAINGGNVTLTLSGLGMVQNDIVVIFNGRSGTGTAADPSGYTNITSQANSTFCVCSVSYKFMGATPDTSAVCPGTGGGQDVTAAVAFIFRGVDTSSPVVNSASNTGLAAPNPPSLVTDANASTYTFVVGASSEIDDSTPGTVTNYTSPTPSVADATDNNPLTTAAAYRITGGSNPEDPAAWSSWSNGRNASITLALKPAAEAITPSFSDFGQQTRNVTSYNSGHLFSCEVAVPTPLPNKAFSPFDKQQARLSNRSDTQFSKFPYPESQNFPDKFTKYQEFAYQLPRYRNYTEPTTFSQVFPYPFPAYTAPINVFFQPFDKQQARFRNWSELHQQMNLVNQVSPVPNNAFTQFDNRNQSPLPRGNRSDTFSAGVAQGTITPSGTRIFSYISSSYIQ